MKKLTHEDAEKSLIEKGIEVKMVDRFIDRKTKMQFECSCGKFFVSTYASVSQGSRCGCKKEDFIGKRYGYVTVLEKTNEKRYDKPLYKCVCDCGKEFLSGIAMLTSGDRTSCGCKRHYDLTDRRFGRLVALYIESNPNGQPRWFCQCDCGNTHIVRSSDLLSGDIQSCGCYYRDVNRRDITGMRSGKLVAIEPTNETDASKNVIWKSQCDCGRIHYIRTSSIVDQSTQSCGNCGTFVRGIKVSKPQLELHRLLGRGVLNFKARCGLRPDIAFVHNGEKIAIEYDEEHWHDEKEDEIKTKRLLADGWKVIRILVSNKMPNQKFLDYINQGLGLDNKCCLTTI